MSTELAVIPSWGTWIVTEAWCVDFSWRLVISRHRTKEEADANLETLRAGKEAEADHED